MPIKKKTKKELAEEKYKWLVALGKRRAKELAKKATKHELLFYKFLKEIGIKFEFQKPVICNKKTLYILDFYLYEYNIAVELDGRQHFTKEGLKKDSLRSRRLKKEGIIVKRLTNRQVSTYDKDMLTSLINSYITPK